MNATAPERLVRAFFAGADIEIGGYRPWDIQVHHDRFYKRLVAGGSMALGESYMDGWWDCPALDEFFDRILKTRLDQQVKKSINALWCSLKAAFTHSPGRFRAFDIGRRHYDIGNDLFRLMLDKWMNYSCAYWKKADGLNAAQEAKMDLICRKLQLRPGLRLLDIGCGWGGLAAYAAAAIAKSPPIPTGLQGFMYDIRTAILPFMFIFNSDLILHNVHSWPQGILIFLMACMGNFAFASATQGWLITRNRFYEVPLLLCVTFILMRPDAVAGWIGVAHDQRYWVYPLGLALFGLIYLIQRPRSLKAAKLAATQG